MATCKTKIFPWIHLRTPIEIARTKEYGLWNKTSEPAVYNLLHSYIVRAEQDNKLGNYIFEEFYQKGKLCARYSVEDIAEMLEMSVGSVSKHLNSMDRKGYIKIVRIPWRSHSINFYEFGYHTSRPEYFEHLYAWTTISNNNAKAKIDEFK